MLGTISVHHLSKNFLLALTYAMDPQIWELQASANGGSNEWRNIPCLRAYLFFVAPGTILFLSALSHCASDVACAGSSCVPDSRYGFWIDLAMCAEIPESFAGSYEKSGQSGGFERDESRRRGRKFQAVRWCFQGRDLDQACGWEC